MLAKCLNPACDAKFQYLNQGRVFNIETAVPGDEVKQTTARSSDCFWLCGSCCLTMKVIVDNGFVTAAPLEPAEIVSSLEEHQDEGELRRECVPC